MALRGGVLPHRSVEHVRTRGSQRLKRQRSGPVESNPEVLRIAVRPRRRHSGNLGCTAPAGPHGIRQSHVRHGNTKRSPLRQDTLVLTSNRCLHAFHTCIIRMLSTDDPTGVWGSRRGSPSAGAWTRIFGSAGASMMLHPEEPYISTFVGGLPLELRLAVPSGRRRAVLLGGDATPSMLYAINYGHTPRRPPSARPAPRIRLNNALGLAGREPH